KLTSRSPAGTALVDVIERGGVTSRRIELLLDYHGPAGWRRATVYKSLPEPAASGGERVIWALDGSKFVLVGRGFNLPGSLALPDGTALYLLCDAASGRCWCNSPEQSTFPPFDWHDLKDIDWQEPALSRDR
ncbi:MAG TPA: hypothetical protein VGF55_31255, partial [Gemmataceae bacterium]